MPRMTNWVEYFYYDIQTDTNVSRLSGFDERNQSHWTVIPTGRNYRERRTDALVRIQEWIESGNPAGEIYEEQ